MRRLRYQVAASLDGYIAGPKGEFDWIPNDPDIDFTALWAAYDTLVMGRKTYEAMQGMGGGKGVQSIVYSTTLDPAKHKKVTVVKTDPVAHVRELKAKPGKDIWLFGGGALFRSLLAGGVVDTVEPALCPVLLGGGIPLLPGPAALAKLSLTSHKLYPKSGIVLLEYAVSALKIRSEVCMSVPEYAQRLRDAVESATPHLLAIADDAAGRAPAPGKWSPREVVGHLVDSAANNHQRFVRGQLQDDLVFLGYAQEDWVRVQDYAHAPWQDLVALWRLYNRHLARVMELTPADRRLAPRATHNIQEIGFAAPIEATATLDGIMLDYVEHLLHHLRQLGVASA